MNFTEIADLPNPGRPELHEFLDGVIGFLAFVLDDTEHFAFLWEDDPELLPLARESFADVQNGARDLHGRIDKIPAQVLAAHGLVGGSARFKYRVFASISKGWDRFWDQFKIRDWFRRMVAAIDAILDSILAAVGGQVGGLIKEFKDALAALPKTLLPGGNP